MIPTLALLIGLLLAPAPWTEVARERDIVVEQRVEEGETLPRFRATVRVDARLPAVARVLAEGDRHRDWMHNTRESKVLARRGRVFFVYQRLFSPPPVSDRDVVLRVERFDFRGGCRFEFRAVDHPDAPTAASVVRMRRLEGRFELRRLGGGQTEIVYEVLADPGGRLPVWMARRGLREMPLQTLHNLRALVVPGGSVGFVPH